MEIICDIPNCKDEAMYVQPDEIKLCPHHWYECRVETPPMDTKTHYPYVKCKNCGKLVLDIGVHYWFKIEERRKG